MTTELPLTSAQPGDLADHISGDLDPREVTRIDLATNSVWLDILGAETGPYPATNYTYTRTKES